MLWGWFDPMYLVFLAPGEAPLVEVATEAGRLVTTGKQPLTLADGGTKGAADVTAGDAIVRWRADGRIFRQDQIIFSSTQDQLGVFRGTITPWRPSTPPPGAIPITPTRLTELCAVGWPGLESSDAIV